MKLVVKKSRISFIVLFANVLVFLCDGENVREPRKADSLTVEWPDEQKHEKSDLNFDKIRVTQHEQPKVLQNSDHGTEHWGYELDNGPEKWGAQCKNGLRQSPIDIRASAVEFAFINEIHFVNYDLSGAVQIHNTGHGGKRVFLGALTDESMKIGGFEKWSVRNRPYIYGGGLGGKYHLLQFHFHWAAEHEDGSEHTINKLHYPVEVHFVHIKDGLNASEAMMQPNGLAVIGVFMYIGKDGTALATLDSALRDVKIKDTSILVFNYTTGVGLPRNTENFYRYEGSLTTPGCNEAVIWTLFPEPVSITESQLDLLREIEYDHGKRLDYNNRPTQPLNGRRIYYRSSTMNRHKLCNCTERSENGVAHTFYPHTTSIAITVSIILAWISGRFFL